MSGGGVLGVHQWPVGGLGRRGGPNMVKNFLILLTIAFFFRFFRFLVSIPVCKGHMKANSPLPVRLRWYIRT
jgi:hypothetical protein